MHKEAEPVLMPRVAGSPARRRVLRLAAVLTGVAVSLLAAELALRAMYQLNYRHGNTLHEQLVRSRNSSMTEAQGEVSLRGLVQPCLNPEIVYEAKPGLKGNFRNKPVSINRFGLRGVETTVEKPAGTYRIVGLGDSVMFGWGVGQDDFFLKVLERKLNELPPPHPRFEALNFALPGYNTYMEVVAFREKALPFQPDLVVIQFVSNDFGVPHFMLLPPDPWTLKKSYLWELMAARLGWTTDGEEGGLVRDRLQGFSLEEKGRVLKPYRHMVGPRGYVRAMDMLAELTGPRHIPVVILIGHYSQMQGNIIRRMADAHGFHILDIGPWTERVLDEMGLPEDSKARDRALSVAPGDSHPNALGHEIYARGLLEKLIELGVLKQGAAPAP